MQVDLDGLAANIKAAIGGPRKDEWRFMVDEMVRHIRELEEKVKATENARDVYFNIAAGGSN